MPRKPLSAKRSSKKALGGLLLPFNKADEEELALLAAGFSSEKVEFDKICKRLREWLRAESCAIFVADHKPGARARLLLVGQDSVNRVRTKPKSTEIRSREGGGFTAHIASLGRTVNMDHGELLDNRHFVRRTGTPSPFIRDHTDYSLLAVPLTDRKGRLVGLLKLLNKLDRKLGAGPDLRFSKRDEAAAERFSCRLMMTLESRKFMRFSQRLLRASESLGVGVQSRLPASILREALALVGADCGVTALADRDGDTLLVRHRVNVRTSFGSMPPQSIVAADWRSRNRIGGPSLSPPNRSTILSPKSKDQIHALIPAGSPGARQPFAGVLVAESDGSHPFDDIDKSVLRNAAAAYADALRGESRAQAFDLALQLQTLPDLGSEEIYKRVLECVRSGLGFDSGILYEADGPQRDLVLKAHMGCHHLDPDDKMRVQLSRKSLASAIFWERKSMFSLRPEADPMVSKRGLKFFKIAGPMIGVPLVHSGAPLGVMLFWSRSGATPANWHCGPLEAFAHTAAAELARSRVDFLWGTFVHKVKNYAWPIYNVPEYLDQPQLGDKGRVAVGWLKTNAELLRDAVRSATTYRRLIASKPARETFCLTKCVRDVVESQTPLAHDKCVSFETHVISRRLPFEGDREKLADALVNVISNAIRHSPEGEAVRVALNLDRRNVDITVCNRGEEIPMENRELIFEPFVSLLSSADPMDRSGIGLAAARLGAAANGGTLILLPRQKHWPGGASFRFRFPIQRLQTSDMR